MLVVLLVIVMLSGLAAAGWGSVRTSQRKQATSLRIEQLTHAVASLEEDGALPASGLEDDLVKYLVEDPIAAGKAPYLELSAKMVNASRQFLDAWGNPLVYQHGITTPAAGWVYGSRGGKNYLNGTASTPLVIRSSAGTTTGADAARDDVVWTYTNMSGWNRLP